VEINEKVIARVEVAISMGVEVEEIIAFLAQDGIVGYDAWLAYKAGEQMLKFHTNLMRIT
jgi:hypothetical protein